MFNNNQYNNGNGVNVNTNFGTSYSDVASVQIGAWNRQLSVRIQPAIGKNADGITQYTTDRTQVITTAITHENAILLLEGMNEKLLPAIAEGKAKSISVPMGKPDSRKVFTIGFDGKESYIEVATGVNENGVAADGNCIHHVLAKREYMEDYNHTTGQSVNVEVEVELLKLKAEIEKINDLIPAVAHSISYNNALKSAYAQHKQSDSGAGNYSAPMMNASDPSDFLPFN